MLKKSLLFQLPNGIALAQNSKETPLQNAALNAAGNYVSVEGEYI